MGYSVDISMNEFVLDALKMAIKQSINEINPPFRQGFNTVVKNIKVLRKFE
ncbi:hypothetical protein MASR2M69_05260 [Bacteroidota bacterium]